MMIRSACCGALWLLVGLAIPATAAAQANNETLLKGRDVTEENVLEALVPGPPAASDGASVPASGIKTRAIHTSVRATPAEEVLKRARRKPSASLLITFETNSSELTARSKEQLDVVAAALQCCRRSGKHFFETL